MQSLCYIVVDPKQFRVIRVIVVPGPPKSDTAIRVQGLGTQICCLRVPNTIQIMAVGT